jgi:hypothetical protein
MTLTVRDVGDLTRILTRYPEWRAEMRRIVLGNELLSLPEAMRELAAAQARTEAAQARTEERVGRLEEAVANLAAAQARTEQTVKELVAAQARIEERVGRLEEAVTNLAAAQARTEQRLEELATAQVRTELRLEELVAAQARLEAAQARAEQRMDKMDHDLGKLKGWALERQYADKAPAVFGLWLRRLRVLLPGSLDAATEDRLLAHLTEAEYQDVLRLDLVLRGRPVRAAERAEVYLAVEVSGIIDRRDVDRAQRRAGLLRKAGLPAVPVVAGEDVTEGAAALLHEVPVAVALDGYCEGWEKALAAVVA